MEVFVLLIIFPTNTDTKPFRSRCIFFHINMSASTINTTGLHWQQFCRTIFRLEVTVKKERLVSVNAFKNSHRNLKFPLRRVSGE